MSKKTDDHAADKQTKAEVPARLSDDEMVVAGGASITETRHAGSSYDWGNPLFYVQMGP